jgi:hypothetical protein
VLIEWFAIHGNECFTDGKWQNSKGRKVQQKTVFSFIGNKVSRVARGLGEVYLKPCIFFAQVRKW